MRLDGLLKYFAKRKSGRKVGQKDLIVLRTADGTLVCPEQQFERTDEAGNRTLEVSPYTIALWRVTGLSGHNGWTRAASLAVKHKITGYQYSLFDIATNREISDKDKHLSFGVFWLRKVKEQIGTATLTSIRSVRRLLHILRMTLVSLSKNR
ncbi:hypothetical protein HG433_001800 [Candidatus Saccharibacteria bacterium]|nr:hypothetical protein [Candidatus Saccharibacteria bacterium]